MTVNELVAAYQDGNESVLLELWNSVQRFASKLVGAVIDRSLDSRVERVDLMQEAFIAMVAAAKTYNPEAGKTFIGWYAFFLKTAFAVALGYKTSKEDALLRSISLDAPLADDEDEDFSLLSTLEDPDTDVAAEAERKIFIEQLHQELENTLQLITPERAEVLRQAYFENLPYPVIAEKLGISNLQVHAMKRKAFEELHKVTHTKQGCKLAKFLDDHTNFYLGSGYRAFEKSHTSTVERAVLHREKIEKFYKNYL